MNARDKCGNTALIMGAWYGQSSIVEVLISSGSISHNQNVTDGTDISYCPPLISGTLHCKNAFVIIVHSALELYTFFCIRLT